MFYGDALWVTKFNVGLVDNLKDLGQSKAPDICRREWQIAVAVITPDVDVVLTQSMRVTRQDNQWGCNFSRTCFA